MKKILSIDIFRSVALLLVVIYHIWVLSGQWYIIDPIRSYIVLGGEIGVTAFFLLSGYGIYFSIDNMFSNDDVSYIKFYQRRIKRIVPEYYFNIILCLLLTAQAQYLSSEHLVNIISHFLFLHSFNPSWFGAINGVLWTMAIIVQFYIIAIPLYKCIKWKPYITLLLCIVGTIMTKYYVYTLFMPFIGMDTSSNFFMGRQLVTSFDNFIIGMFIGYIIKDNYYEIKYKYANIIFIISILGIYGICQVGFKYGIHTSNLSGATWHSLLAMFLGLLMYAVSYFKVVDNCMTRIFLWISRYEYSIYLWHLIMIRTLIDYSSFIKNMINNGNNILIVIILSFLSIFIGYIMNKSCDTSVIDVFILNNISKVRNDNNVR